jgi:uncharacterized repeat protein (TIGR01451 family)
MSSELRPEHRALNVSRVLTLTPVLALLFVISLLGTAPRRAEASQGGPENVQVYAGDCATPQTYFSPGDTVCAVAGGFPLTPGSAFRYRRFQWVAPTSSVADLTNIKVDPQGDKFVIPTSGAIFGTWYVRSIDSSGEGQARAKFIVRDRERRFVDLSVVKSGPVRFLPGERVQYTLTISNLGPDYAEKIEFGTEVLSNTTFVGVKHADGPVPECKTPTRGESGSTICFVGGLKPDESVTLVFYYQVDREVRIDTPCTGTTKVSSATEDLNYDDNAIQTEALVTKPDSEETGNNEEPPQG